MNYTFIFEQKYDIVIIEKVFNTSYFPYIGEKLYDF